MRNKSIDIAKGIGIILVVIGHTNSSLHDFIYLFHMPLFFFLSGYAYKEIDSYNPIKVIKKRFKSLYIPFVKIQVGYLIFHNIFIRMNILNSGNVSGKVFEILDFNNFIKSLIQILTFGMSEQLAGPLWFLYSLFFTIIIFTIISYIHNKIVYGKNKEIIRFITIIIVFICGNIISYYDIYIPRNLDVPLVAILFFYLGYMYKLNEKLVKFSIKNIFICIPILYLSSLYGTLEFGSNEIVNPIFLIINSFIGIYLILTVAEYIKNTFLNKIFIFIGTNTMVILAYHCLAFKLVSYLIIIIKNLPISYLALFPTIDIDGKWWIMYSLIGVSIPLIIQSIVKKVKYYINERYNECISKYEEKNI